MTDPENPPPLPVSPLWLGILAGLILMTIILPGGYDGWLYYFNPWRDTTTAPAWVHLLLAPITLLPPYPAPFRWIVLVVVTALTVRAGVMLFGKRWIWVVFSVPFWWTVWLGQIEFIAILSVILGWLVIEKKAHPLWMGFAIIGLLTKIQVGGGIAVLFTLWMIQLYGWKSFLWAGVSMAGVLGMTLLMYPNWIALWLDSLRVLSPSGRFFDSSIFPIGVLAWGGALIPIAMPKITRLRLVASATLLGSPYFATYHCLTLLTISSRPQYWAVSWLTVVPMVLFNNQRFGWIIPVAVMVGELWEIWRKRATP
jgi:hypothetical protein